jgi:hypothetical protein
MAFHDKPFAQRYGGLGDLAEAAYLERLPHGPAQRLGWQRPKVSMASMTDFIRYMPDFYTSSGFLVEVMGCGKDGVLKGMKVAKWAAMLNWAWASNQPLVFWLWNSHLRHGRTITVRQMTALVANSADTYGVQKFEVDGNEYHPIPWAWIEEAGVNGSADHPSDIDSAGPSGAEWGDTAAPREDPAGAAGGGGAGDAAPAGP